MTDLTTHLMLDDVDLTLEEKHVTPNVVAIAGYVNGRFANWPAIVAKYRNSGKHLLSIDVQGNYTAGAQCLDVERGDASVHDAPGWVRETRKAGMAARDLRYFPKVYTSESNLQAVVDACSAAGIQRGEYLLWSAHYGAGKHICGPKSCGSKVQADATQWTNSYEGVNLDASICFGYFFEGAPKPVPPAVNIPVPPVEKVAMPDVVGKLGPVAEAELVAAGFKVHSSPVAVVAGTVVTHQDPAAGVKVDKDSVVTLLIKALPAPVPTDVNIPAPAPAPVVVTAFVRTDYAKAASVDVPAGAILFVPKDFNA